MVRSCWCPRKLVVAVLLVVVPIMVTGAARSSAMSTEGSPVGTWPLAPRPEVVATFDPPGSPWGAGHRGVDLLGAVGLAVRSALPGTVSFAAPLAGRGVVVVDHGPTRTTYEPVVPGVRVGDRVAAGQVVGRLTSTQSHCYPRVCLHWGWRRGETYLDPMHLVGGGPVRLLPLWWGATAGPPAFPVRPSVSPVWQRTAYAAWRPEVDRPLVKGLLP